MALPQCTISPNLAAAAGCTVTVELMYTYTDYGSNYKYYRISATAAPGWTFSKFSWSEKYVYTDGETVIIGPVEQFDNPYPREISTYSTLQDGEYRYSGGLIYTTEILNLTALFRRAKTNLLIYNDKDVPEQLVYDPTTNLLVADF